MYRKVKQRFISGILAVILIVMGSGVSYAEDLESGEQDMQGERVAENEETDMEEEGVSYQSVQQSFTLPSESSEFWLPIHVDEAGCSVDITVSSDDGKFEAPVSYLLCKGKDTENYIGELGTITMGGTAITENNTSSFHIREAGDYNVRITNASYINNIYYAGQVNTKPLHVSYEFTLGDKYEDNDTKEKATILNTNKPVEFTLNGQNDEDWFMFEVVDGDIPIMFSLDNAVKGEELWREFDSPICYSLYLDLGGSLETIASNTGSYAAGAERRPVTKEVSINSPGIYYLQLLNASEINTLYYGKGDNKSPMSLSCNFAGRDMEVLYDSSLGEEITDIDLFRDYPECLQNDFTNKVENNIQDKIDQALKEVYGEEFLTAYKYALDKGGISIFLKEAFAFLGWGKGMEEEFAEDAAREYIDALCENENYMEEIAVKSLSKLKEVKKWSKIAAEEITSSMADDIKADFKWINRKEAEELLDAVEERWKSVSDIWKEGQRVLTVSELIISVLTLQDIRIEVIFSLKSSLPTHSELYKELCKLESKMVCDPSEVIIEDFLSKTVSEEVISQIADVAAKAITDYITQGEVSSVTMAMGKWEQNLLAK